MNRGDKKPAASTFWTVIIFVAAVIVVGLCDPLQVVYRWLIIASLVVGLLAVLGHQTHGRLVGVLIDARYKISLSRVQVTLWTILVFSAYLIMALSRSAPGGLKPLSEKERMRVEVEACAKYLRDQDSETAYEMARLLESGRARDLEEAGRMVDALKADDQGLSQALERAVKASRQPLKITFPPELLLVLGISAASFAGSNLIKSTKKQKESALVEERRERVRAAEEERERAEERLRRLPGAGRDEAGYHPGNAEAGVDLATEERDTALEEKRAAEDALVRARKELGVARDAQERSVGLLHGNTSADQAEWGDIIRFEEVGNYKEIDLGKVQMLFTTLATLAVYAVSMYQLLARPDALGSPLGVDLPAPAHSQTLSGLLGLSQGSYLVSKNTDHTPVG